MGRSYYGPIYDDSSADASAIRKYLNESSVLSNQADEPLSAGSGDTRVDDGTLGLDKAGSLSSSSISSSSSTPFSSSSSSFTSVLQFADTVRQFADANRSSDAQHSAATPGRQMSPDRSTTLRSSWSAISASPDDSFLAADHSLDDKANLRRTLLSPDRSPAPKLSLISSSLAPPLPLSQPSSELEHPASVSTGEISDGDVVFVDLYYVSPGVADSRRRNPKRSDDQCARCYQDLPCSGSGSSCLTGCGCGNDDDGEMGDVGFVESLCACFGTKLGGLENHQRSPPSAIVDHSPPRRVPPRRGGPP